MCSHTRDMSLMTLFNCQIMYTNVMQTFYSNQSAVFDVKALSHHQRVRQQCSRSIYARCGINGYDSVLFARQNKGISPYMKKGLPMLPS